MFPYYILNFQKPSIPTRDHEGKNNIGYGRIASILTKQQNK